MADVLRENHLSVNQYEYELGKSQYLQSQTAVSVCFGLVITM